MTWGYGVFMGFMIGAWVAMVTAWLRTVFFFRRNRQPEQDQLNPLHGPRLWGRFFTSGAFGAAEEPARAAITRTWMLAGALFVLAIVAFLVLPGIPGFETAGG